MTTTTKKYATENLIVAALNYISEEWYRVMWNINQKEMPNPFGNTGAKWKCDEFEVEAYDWNEDGKQAYNFKWENIYISWYKYLGRGMVFDEEIPAEKISEMLTSCLIALQKYEKEHTT